MPITVEHGGVAGPGAGQIIAQAGQASLNRQQQDQHLATQLQFQRDQQLTQIDAQANLQRQAADHAMAQTALQHGLQGELQQQTFDNTIKQMQEGARIQASQFDYHFTAEQRQSIAKFNTARQTITSSSEWSPDEKAVALKQIDLEQANIKPSMMPRDPSKPIYEPGKGPGELQIDPKTGATFTLDKDGRTAKLIQRWDQGPEAGKLKHQAEQSKQALDAQMKREEHILKIRADLLSKPVKGTDAIGTPTSRDRTPEEVDAIMQHVTGQQPQQQQWWDTATKRGLNVTDGDKQLPDQVGYAQSFIRTVNSKYGGFQKVPQDQRAAYLSAANILRQYQSQAAQGQPDDQQEE